MLAFIRNIFRLTLHVKTPLALLAVVGFWFAAWNAAHMVRGVRKTVGSAVDQVAWNSCVLPQFDPWDPEILPFADPDYDPTVGCQTFDYTVMSEGRVQLTAKGKADDVTCHARCHVRVNDWNSKIGPWQKLGQKMDCEVVEAVCSTNNNSDYTYGRMHTQIIPVNTTQEKTKKEKKHHVFVLLLDSVAHSQTVRLLTQTMNYFEKSMKAVTFPYVNKVGMNSRPNAVALWFGKQMEAIDRKMFGGKVEDPNWSEEICNLFIDNYTSIFKEFRDKNYKTLYAEDWGRGAMNYPNCWGFNQQPTDHDIRPLMKALENFGEKITMGSYKSDSCLEYYPSIVNYFEQFLGAYPNEPKMAWVWISTISHDYENSLAHVDKVFYKFLVKHRKQFDDAFVFIMGDHGLRFGDVAKTRLGALDVNNPLLSISVPKSLRKSTRLLELLRENAAKLQTHYDTRATLLDILKYQPDERFRGVDYLDIPGERGSSLLRMQKAEPRNCRSLPIPLEYCICQFDQVSLESGSTKQELGKFVTQKVNLWIKEANFSTKCIEMEFKETESALMFSNDLQAADIYDVVVAMMAPSNAKFRARVRETATGMEILGSVDRTDSYGRTADCITENSIRPLCFCRENNKN